ncbi:pre-B-cell leukemia transcription factor-interacting protein 1 isoform X1 [Trichechus manatus latirostris]|uniref:Pre-B-cell leukemia transcription factor-interacting protein 1 isoform X1 n=1 Tax=Trichechus manatus latirostris TaxID=127582 RepID=A0A2Y9RXT0_TRIMA|nr:pre-B-cell leukemia transcription factor-interacting protein 1 isoform X1 [Trichechus manatus latirostris]XP_023598335.1 pre-B-cell leukemia transcription factor-interacting protein 1 isoform X1 [Trichechus manatus latirostris]XP_023598336.1 pre-B-cell leukemia transcription factor-interacting protein 1 isoform X1 [Trichechus manatus latirostris]
MASCPDSDKSWVLAGSEPSCSHPSPQSLPVETLGPESTMDPESDMAPQTPPSLSKADGEELAGTLDGEETVFKSEGSQSGPIPPEETEAEGALEGDGCDVVPPDPGDAVAQSDLQETPLVESLGLDTQGLEDQSPPQSSPSAPKAAWIREELRCSSSEDDTDMGMEGLRRRWGRGPSPPQPSASLGVEDQAGSEGVVGELGISLNMCLLGALVLLGLGILLFSGGVSESESGPLEEVELQVIPGTGSDTELQDAVGDGQDGLRELQASAPLGSVPSLQNMALLLDKLAKENQDIRLLQAQLQAQKEELQSLMLQPKRLEEENARLRGALQQGEASQQALESELQQLRTRLQGMKADCIVWGPDGVCLTWGSGLQGDKATEGQGPREQEPGSGFLEQKEQLEAEAQGLRQELERQRRLLGSVQQDLEQSLREAGQGDPAHSGLAKLSHRLAQKLQDLESWGQDPGTPANASGAWGQELHFQSSRERSGKEKWWGGQGNRKAEHWKHKKEGSGGERKSWESEKDREQTRKRKEGKLRVQEWEDKDGKPQGPREPPRKNGSPHSPGEKQKHPRWKEGAKDRHNPLPPWGELLRQKYQAPQGCSGVDECARQEGLAFFGMELAPVRQQELASLLRTYLARLPWAGQLTKELPLSPAYFGEDGVFRHDRLRFRDFVDALEDSLEEVAVRQTGDDDEVDDFEDFIFSHFFGDKALKKRSGKKDKPFRSPRVLGPREEHSHHHSHRHRG